MSLWGIREFVVGNVFLYPLVILILTAILARVTMVILEGLLQYFHKRSKNFNHKIVSLIETPFITIIVLIGLLLSLKNAFTANSHLNNFVLSIIVIFVCFMFIRVSDILLVAWSKKVTEEKGEEFHEEILPLAKSISTILLIIVSFLLVLQIWGVAVGSLITSMGIAGLIIGFSLKQTLENIFGGISLIVDNSFKKHDLIQLDDGSMGEVIEINLRSTKLKNFDSEIVLVPNGQLSNSRIINLAQPTPTVRVKIPVGVAYGSDIDVVKKVLHDSMKGHPKILKMPKRNVRIANFGEYSVDFEVLFFISNYQEVFSVKDEIMRSIYFDLYAAGIEIPFPVRTVIGAKNKQYDKKWKGKKFFNESNK